MKKQFLLFLFSILTCNIFAQSNSIGVYAGFNVSNAKIENYVDNDSKTLTSFIYGINYQRVFNIPFVIDCGLLMNNNGYKIEVGYRDENNADLGTCDTPWEYRYVSMPILFGYRFGDKLSITPKIGVQMSYLMDSRLNGDHNGASINDKQDLKYFHRFDLAGVVEAEFGYEFYNNWGVFVCLSGKYSFTNTADFINILKDTTIHHYSFSTVCGVKYSF